MKTLPFERAAIVITPVLALATVAIGLRVGASSRSFGAKVYAASPGLGRSGLSLQLVTLAAEGGVPEVIQVPGMTVVGTTHGAEARWHGASNSEGVAEAWLGLDGLHAKDDVRLSITGDDGTPLGSGVIEVPASQPDATSSSELPATRRSGTLFVELYIYGGKLVPGASTHVFAHVRDTATRRPIDGAHLTIDPEPGLTVDAPFASTSAGGWSDARVTADFLLAGWTLSAEASVIQTGTWYGSLPVSPGAATVNLPPDVTPEVALPLRFTVPPASPRLYVVVADAVGCDFSAAIEVAPGHRGGTASIDLPPLTPGIYWLMTSADARGAEASTPSSVARPFRVGAHKDTSEPPLQSLATLSPPKPARAMVLDGLVSPFQLASRSRRRGLRIALGAIAIATVLETLLILRAASRARTKMKAVTDAALEVGAPSTKGDGAGTATGIAILVLATLLGFALLAALLLIRGGP